MPPYILYKGKNLYSSWTTGGPAGTLFGVSDSGWMERANFLDWFKKLFLPAIQHLGSTPGVVLFVDGHHSHLSLDLLELAKKSGVHLVCFPPHLTHILQPLDVTVYHPLKQAWAIVLKDFKLETMAENVTKIVFPSLINKLWDRSFKSSHIVSGFHATGLHPLDQAPVICKLSTSAPFRAPSAAPSTSSTAHSATMSVSATASMQSTSSASLPATSSVIGTGTVRLEIKGKCHNCGAELTPMRPHLTMHFEKLLQKKHADTRATTTRKRVRANYYGEALTSDDMLQRLQDEEKARKAKKKRKRVPTPSPEPATDKEDSHTDNDNSHNEDVCQVCGKSDQEPNKWIGCDNCWRWFHFSCAGFRRKPSARSRFVCVHCK